MREEETQNIGTYFWTLSKYRKIFTGRQRARAHARLERPCARKSTRASLAPVRRSAHAPQTPVHKGARARAPHALARVRARGRQALARTMHARVLRSCTAHSHASDARALEWT